MAGDAVLSDGASEGTTAAAAPQSPPKHRRAVYVAVVFVLCAAVFLQRLAFYSGAGGSRSLDPAPVSHSGAGGSRSLDPPAVSQPFPVPAAVPAALPPPPPSPHVHVVTDPKSLYPATFIPDAGLVYCGIAKIASAEWKRALRWMNNDTNWNSTHRLHNPRKNAIPHLYDLPAERVQEILNDEAWVKIVIVREPAERALSCFLQKCRQIFTWDNWHNCPLSQHLSLFPELLKDQEMLTKKNGGGEALTKIRHEVNAFMQRDVRAGFLAFAQAVAEDIRQKLQAGQCMDINNHWRPQHCSCGLGEHGYASAFRVIPFSNMAAEAVDAMSKLQVATAERRKAIRSFVHERFAKVNDKKTKNTGASNKKDFFLTAEALAVLREAYARDYELFDGHF